MTCPNCKKTIKKDEALSSEGQEVYKVFLVGVNPKTAKTYCSQCVGTRSKGK